MDYIDGFVFPVPSGKLEAYQKLATSIAEIWQEHGALEYREFVGDDMNLDGTRAFPQMVDANPNDVLVFGWVRFASREMRDKANQRVARDPRVTALVESADTGFDPQRMFYGGFRSLVDPSDKSG